ncbi:MAG: hypothetical protein L0Z68_10510, partial [Gammaproteobacteria bacterium]|nr:hypothetical protein [Gammaproteobacteria bacterium]
MSVVNFHTVPNFNDTLYELLKKFEAPHDDPKNIGDGKITIGLGFNLTDGKPDVQDAVFAALGIITDAEKMNPQTPPAGVTAEQIIAEQGYISRLRGAIQNHNIGELHQIMDERSRDSVLDGFADDRHSRFEFWDRNGNGSTDDEIQQAFDEALPFYQRLIFAKPGYDLLDGAVDTDGTPFAESREEMVLLSLAWNGGTALLGDKLRRALIESADRAEAWFEIRYNSNRLGWAYIKGTAQGNELTEINNGIDKGLAKRRFLEAEVFGLYDDPLSISIHEAMQTYRMFTLHREQVFKYEGTYGTDPEGNAGSRGDMVAAANRDYFPLEGSVTEVQTLVDSLDPAKSALVAVLSEQNPNLNLNPDSYLSTNIYLDPGVDAGKSFTEFDPNHRATLDARLYKEGAEHDRSNLLVGEGGDDTLIGNRGADVLIGGSGIDTLDGGASDDILVGGTGKDVYILRTGGGNDRIYDEDGVGFITFIDNYNNQVTLSLTADAVPGEPNRWRSRYPGGGEIIYTMNSPLTIRLPDGTSIVVGDFSNGQLGIDLRP